MNAADPARGPGAKGFVMTLEIDRRRLLAGTAAAALAAPVRGAQAQTAPRQSIAVRVERDPEVIDPGFRTGPHDGNIIRVVYQRLIRHKANSGEMELDAAAELTQTSPTIIDFRLKPGQMFTDGFGEMTAEDVKFSFERIGLEPAAGGRASPYRGDWAGLERVEVTGQYTGRVVLSRPNAGLMSIALGDVSGCIASKRAIEQRGVEHNTRPVGSGAYTVASLERQRGAVLRANPGYAGARPAFQEVAVRFIPDHRATELALRSGELDFRSAAADKRRAAARRAGADGKRAAGAAIHLARHEHGEGAAQRHPRAAGDPARARCGSDAGRRLQRACAAAECADPRADPGSLARSAGLSPQHRGGAAAARRGGARNLRVKLLVLNTPSFQTWRWWRARCCRRSASPSRSKRATAAGSGLPGAAMRGATSRCT
jgi:hypothetical protein